MGRDTFDLCKQDDLNSHCSQHIQVDILRKDFRDILEHSHIELDHPELGSLRLVHMAKESMDLFLEEELLFIKNTDN